MKYYGYDEYLKDMKKLVKKIDFDFDAIVGVARGGMTIAHMLGEYFGTRNVFTINSIAYEDTKKLDAVKVFNIPDLKNFRKILIVDDIVDSGDTMRKIISVLKKRYPDAEFKVAALFYRPDAGFKPDYYAAVTNEWIDFFWVKDLK
ncbi:phosphoribosyltransferase [Nitrosophilus alvini]|uniref:phosphoribosyltransferase n=1 Tax=Nitrosophilus alvini TaxID=2714855 RepID=UPI00190A2DEA|nr:phosphoribosyltransferase family protein [Nitrosophilus alvini]